VRNAGGDVAEAGVNNTPPNTPTKPPRLSNAQVWTGVALVLAVIWGVVAWGVMT
jgi:hypothetical protein